VLLKTITSYCKIMKCAGARRSNVEGELGDDLVGVAENHVKTISMTNIIHSYMILTSERKMN
jgi:hypothetical protein